MRTLAYRAAAVLALAALGWDIAGHYHGWRFALGDWPVPPGTPWTYQLWSGFIAALSVLSLASAVWTAVRRHNCHVHGCWRTGRYPVAGGQFQVCRVHHPAPAVSARRLTAHHIRALHLDYHGKGTRR